MPVVKVNGVEVEVPAGTNMIEAAARVGVDIPHYCYHPHLPIAGNCRMCAVEIEAGGRGTDIACNMVARDGLAIRTDTERVGQMRKSVMEFLLVNHPLDCPICDQAGECRLQDYYMEHGGYESRTADAKVGKHKRQDIGDYLVLDAERCVACSRCVRFGDHVTKTGELRLFNRTDHTEIGIFPGTRIEHHYQGCLADVCPVGALTNKDFRFKKRVWWLREADSVCDGCATGCNIKVCHQQGEVFRYLPRRNDAVNQSWMCDFGRVSYKKIGGTDRILRARIHGTAVGLEDAVARVAEELASTAARHGASAVGAVIGTRATNEANWALVRTLQDNLPGARLFTCEGNDPGSVDYSDDLLVSADKNPNTAGARLLAAWQGGVGDRLDLAASVASGDVRLLIVVEDDVVGRLGDLPRLEGLIYLGAFENQTSASARFVLPAASHVEIDGTFVNRQGRVQRLTAAIPPAGDSRPANALCDLVGTRLGRSPRAVSAAIVFGDIATEVPEFAGLCWAGLSGGGALVHAPAADPAAPQPASPA